jgi:hypothetical protein
MYGAAGGSLRQPLTSGGGGGGGVPLPPAGTGSGGNSRSWFTFGELQAATNDFAQENLLGEGGFGRVFKGQLTNGQMIAVKQLTVGGSQGDREFRAEVEIIGRVHHRHLVSLVGYCIVDKQRLLVYDFVPNGTLDVNLYGKTIVRISSCCIRFYFGKEYTERMEPLGAVKVKVTTNR